MFDRIFNDDKSNEEKIDIQNIDKNYKLKNGNYFHFHTNEEGYYYAIYDKLGFEQDGGLLEYSDNEENETLMSIRKRLADFTDIEELADEKLEEISQDDMDYITSGQKAEDVAEEIKTKLESCDGTRSEKIGEEYDISFGQGRQKGNSQENADCSYKTTGVRKYQYQDERQGQGQKQGNGYGRQQGKS